jgi:hypothetical protein
MASGGGGSISGNGGVRDDVVVSTRGNGMASPPSCNVCVDTAALSAEESLQSALALFTKYPNLFKNTSGSDIPLSITVIHESTKSAVACATVASLEADDYLLDLLDQHPF